MLWYKAWLETRSRFLISLIGMVALCSVFVLHGDRNAVYEVPRITTTTCSLKATRYW